MHPWKLIALTAASLILAACRSTPPAQSLPTTTLTDFPTLAASGTRTSPPAQPPPSATPTNLPTHAASITPTSSSITAPSATPTTRVTPEASNTSTPTGAPPPGGLPDLTVTAWYYATEPLVLPCMDHNPSMAFRVCVANTGTAPAGPFVVIAEGYPGGRWDIAGLNPGEELCQESLTGWTGRITVDPNNAVPELNDEYNYTYAPLPTQHPQCTPTP